MKTIILISTLLLGVATDQGAQFRPWTQFPKASFKETKLWRDVSSGAYCFVTDHSRVDADGAPNAYHPDDRARKKTPFLGLDDPANAGWPGTSWWNSVLVPDPKNSAEPYRQEDGPFKGYFVAQSALRSKRGKSTDPATYADARSVPYIVLPGNSFPVQPGTGAPGDVGIAWNLANGKSTAFVIGDTGGGPDARLGEGSIALFKALGGKDPNARDGSGVASGSMRFVVFPGSRKILSWPASNDEVSKLAKERLEAIGGLNALSGCVP